jgi:hypothetical protein
MDEATRRKELSPQKKITPSLQGTFPKKQVNGVNARSPLKQLEPKQRVDTNAEVSLEIPNKLGLATGTVDTLQNSSTAEMSIADKKTPAGSLPDSKVATSPSQSFSRRVRKGQKYEELQAHSMHQPSLNQIDSPFQLQEYLAILVKHNPHDVDAIVRLPQASVASVDAFEGEMKGKETASDDDFMGNGGEEDSQLVDTDVWVYEQLRKIVADFTTPWLLALQRECDSKQKPASCEAMNAKDWMYLCASHGEEKQCCAIDYVIHTLDGTTALLNSQRHFPSRTCIPTTSLRHFGSVSRRLSRIFVHAYEHHRNTFEECEAETSLYARFVALVEAYDLISVDSLPRLGNTKVDSTEKGVRQVDGRQRRPPADTSDDFTRHTEASPVPRRLFDSGMALSSEVPTDEGGGEDDNDVDMDEAVLGEEVSARLRRSDSNASRITAVHIEDVKST